MEADLQSWDLLPAHGSGAVDHEREGGRLLHLLVGRLEFDRQDLLDRGAVVAADAERIHPADHDEAAAEFPDVVADRRHARLADLVRRHVGEDDPVVASEFAERLRHRLWRAVLQADPLLRHRVSQVVRLRLLAFDVEQQRFATDIDDGQRLVVLGDAVALETLDDDPVVVDIALVGRAQESLGLVHTDLELELPAIDHQSVLEQPDGALAADRALDVGVEFEARPLVEPRLAAAHLGHAHIGALLAADAEGVEFHARDRRLARRFLQIPAGLLAVARCR